MREARRHLPSPSQIHDGSRLEKLVELKNLDYVARHELEQSFASIIMAEKVIMYGGAALFVLHVARNRLRVTRMTPVFAVAPYFVWLAAKFVGSKWVDYQMEAKGVY